MKSKWGIISDLIRIIKSNSHIDMGETELEDAHDDLANIMDYMIIKKCNFKKALEMYREEDPNNAEWLDEIIEEFKLT
jgi:hypothetical protein